MAETTSGRANILIVDGTCGGIELLVGLLGDEHELSIATCGQQAQALLGAGCRPDLVLLDSTMREMEGEVVWATLERDAAMRSVPVIFLMPRTDANRESACLAAGAADVIQRPFGAGLVRARVQHHLELARCKAALKRSLADVKLAQERSQVLSIAIEQSPTSVMISGPDGAIQYVNPQFTRESGYSSDEVIGQNPRILNSGFTDPSTFAAMWDSLVRGEPWTGELMNRRKNGEVYWEEIHVAPVKDENEETIHYVAVKLDITERKRVHERLAYLAHHDALTGLPNRALFFERVAEALAQARLNRTRLALLFVDLDRFKPINDSCGHAAGDQVLRNVARRMTDSVSSSDTVGRIGGDEFVVLLRNIDDADGALRVGHRIHGELDRPFAVAGKTLRLSSSIGIAIYPEHGSDEIQLAKHADCAMYHAKEDSQIGIMVYEAGMTAAAAH